MANLKTKNANGEWVEALPTVFTGQFMYAFVTPFDMNGSSGRKYLDLSPYIEEGADFMLIMYPDYTTNRVATVYIHSDGKMRQFLNAVSYGDIAALDEIFPVNGVFDTEELVYDEETRIMEYKYKPSSTSGSDAGMGFNKSLLIYAK